MTPLDKDVYTLTELAKYLKTSERTLKREVESGHLEAFRIGSRLRFRREAVEAYMSRGARSDD